MLALAELLELVAAFLARLFGALFYALSRRYRASVHERWDEGGGWTIAMDVTGAIVGLVLVCAVVFALASD